MIGLNSGLLGVRRVPTTGSATGLWVPNEQSLAQRAGIWPAGPVSGPDYGTKKLAVLFEGANNSTTFTDSGANAVSITAYNGAKITTATFAQGTSSGEFARSSSSYVGFASLGALNFGTGDFSIKFRARMTNLPSPGQAYTVICGLAIFDNTVPYISFDASGSSVTLRLGFHWLGTNITSSAFSVSANTWYDYEVSRTGTTINIKQGGTTVGTGTFGSTVNLGAGGTTIGGNEASNNFDGQLDELVVE